MKGFQNFFQREVKLDVEYIPSKLYVTGTYTPEQAGIEYMPEEFELTYLCSSSGVDYSKLLDCDELRKSIIKQLRDGDL
tara:strand:+ start:2719 stop:2955 length:237 start_codon:yes stop_codon:yes gene_type:complete